MKRLTLILLTVILIVPAFWGAFASGITQIPHENPFTAESRLNLAPSLLHYSKIFDQVAKQDYAKARALVQQLKLDYAHLPEEIIFIMMRYNDLTTDLTERLDRLDSKLDECDQLFFQNKLDAALLKLGEARELVGEVARLIGNISMATDELLGHLAPFVSLQEVEAVNEAKARLQKAIERLRELEEWYRDKLKSLDDEAKGKEDLLITELTLNINPAQIWVGDRVTLWGTLKAGDIPLATRRVPISLRGKYFTAATTMEDGSYEASFALPYWYTPEIEAQAFYLPRGDDKSSFLASSSALKKIDVLFHPTSVRIEVPEKVYPGLPAQINGEVISGGSIVRRSIKVLLDGGSFFEATTGSSGRFQHQVLLTKETGVGEHRLNITVAPENKSRSAGSSIDKTLTVAKVKPEIMVYAPKFIVLPQKVDLTGEVRSPLLLQGRVELTGEVRSILPLAGAALTLQMAGVSTTSTVDEGDFKLGVDLPLRFDVMGFEEMRVNLVPSEPWHLSTGHKVNTFVLNLVYLTIVVAALILTGVAILMKRLRIVRKKEIPFISSKNLPGPGMATELYLPVIKVSPGDNTGIILRAYYLAAAGVQRLARVLFKPQMTLREFLSQVTPPLGKFAELFAKLTSLAEKALYSRYILGNNEASLAQNLASQLRRRWLTISHGR